MYQFESRVRYSETNYNKEMTPHSIVNYFQDCSNFQSEDLSVGLDYWTETKHVWILSSWQVEIFNYPKMNERITI